MPSIRSLAFKYYIKLISIIVLLGETMPSYLCYIKRKLLYIIITAFINC